jgi:membrane protease YdiL (CAAX protease family)
MAWERFRKYFEQSRNLLNSLVTVVPLLILYQLGILLISRESINGVDFLTIVAVKAGGIRGLLILNLILIIIFLIGVIYLHKKQTFQADFILPMIVESAVWAVGMGVLIVFVLKYTFPMASAAAEVSDIRAREPVIKILASIGAGVNEELVFRLALMTFIIWFCVKMFALKRFTGVLIAVLVSSALFSLAHYFIGREKITQYSLLYRFFAGVVFAVIFKLRGFAIAVYTHTLYDIFVLFAGR